MRISSLPSLASCPGWWLLRQREPERTVGMAADTGSAAGRAVQLYHAGHPPREAVALAEQEAPQKFPRADLKRARRLAEAYVADPANPPDVATDMEREVSCTLEDADGAPFRLVGHVDQVRAGKVWDLKAGVFHGGSQLLQAHAMQLAGYSIAGGYEPGGILWLAAYEQPGTVVGWHCPWGRAEAEQLLDTVRADAADLRAGRVLVRPGPHCDWCPAKNPGACLARFRDEPPRREEIE